MDMEQEVASFEEAGFLGEHVPSNIEAIRHNVAPWFELAEDLSEVLQSTAVEGVRTNRGANSDPKTIATGLLMRSCGTLQGAIVMAERGMVNEGLTLARSLLENAFSVAALHDRPDEFVSLLKQDAEAARREQGKFIQAEGLLDAKDVETQKRLQEVVDSIGKDPRLISPKQLARMGPLVKQYLAYQRLSNDAAHPSASSLKRVIATAPDKGSWTYRWGPGTDAEIADVLGQAILAGIPIGVGVTMMCGDQQNNLKLAPLADRFTALSKIPTRAA